MHTYELEAGRAIVRDGVPFCNIAKSNREGAPYIHPSDLDAFARLCAAAPAMLAALQDAAAFLDYVPGTHPTALVEQIRAAVAAIGGADYVGRI